MDGDTLKELAIKVSQYFLDFLESDFKRQQAPRRRIVLQTDGGFKSGMRVAPYPALQRDLWEYLSKDGLAEAELKVKPGFYKRPITQTLTSIIAEQIQAIAERSLQAIRYEVVAQAQLSRGKAIENPERWIAEMRRGLCSEIGTQLVNPLLAMLDGPLSQQAYSVHDSIFSTEGELIELIASKPDTSLTEVLSRYLAQGDPQPLKELLESTLVIADIQAELLAYFERYMAADAFLEFRDLATYATTGEGLQLYLYIGTLKYGANTYPLFYVPLDVKASGEGGYTFSMARHLYVNKRAIEFVLQEQGAQQQRQWLSPIKDRINYLEPTDCLADIAWPLFRGIAEALDVGGQIELEPGPVKQASNTALAVSTALHFAAFERSDDSLLNDYEEMISQARQNEPGVVELFQGIVRGAIEENPVSIHHKVDEHWDGLSLVDRVVINSPVPLNEEQIKILQAVRQGEGKIIVVEGPPGTGKSHTITAIAADCALSSRSCLILSDKTEALNVVQTKLSDAMNQARHDKNFPNPLLRLGQEQANFRRLTGNQTLATVSAYVKAAKSKQPQLQSELQAKRTHLSIDINTTVKAYESIGIKEISQSVASANELDRIAEGLSGSLQSIATEFPHGGIEQAHSATHQIQGYLNELFGHLSCWTLPALEARLRLDAGVVNISAKIEPAELSLFDGMTSDGCYQLELLLNNFDALKMPIFGYLFRGAAIAVLQAKLVEHTSPTRPIVLKQDYPTLRRIVGIFREIKRLLPFEEIPNDQLPVVYRKLSGKLPHAGAVNALNFFEDLQDAYEASDAQVPVTLLAATTGARLSEVWSSSLRFLHAVAPIQRAFASVPNFDYVGTMAQIEKLNVTSMNAEVDNRLVNFMHNFKADARTLASIITNGQKFPEEKFDNVKDSFPVILSSIRQFGEYMPLAPDLFDVVIIDEASQVSVAQAFPALLRAKKIVVLGDTKQFSNTKSSNASNEQNEKYRSELEAFFRRKVSDKAHMLERLSKFDVKCSILEFCQLCANYSTMLRKHFRSYQELISYSSKTFYGGQLQAIKIRGVPLGDVIRFEKIDASNAKTTRSTNEAEASFILDQLEALLEEASPPTVGVITPFREQQALLTTLLFGHSKGADFQEKLRLKVMTFDSCQGEERKIIFYSMVATHDKDALNYVFPVSLDNAEEIVEDKLKVQRLNVGFSRAEEMIWFVHSKPIAEFKGSIAKVLQHYSNILEKGEIDAARTDQSSPMEARVLEWLQNTAFYQNNRDAVEILPQFPIGDYLKQLDPTYQHPAWRVDFLLTFTTPKGMARIVLEYDGFEHHFQPGKQVNIGNHERYMLEADVERQLTLESYGYRFIRINRFNLGRDPVETLSRRLEKLVETLQDDGEMQSLKNLHTEAKGLESGELKTCPKCGMTRQPVDFFDQKLKDGAGGFGRICKVCKGANRSSYSGRWHRR